MQAMNQKARQMARPYESFDAVKEAAKQHWPQLHLGTYDRMSYEDWPLFKEPVLNTNRRTNDLANLQITQAENHSISARIVIGSQQLIDYTIYDPHLTGLKVSPIDSDLYQRNNVFRERFLSLLPIDSEKMNAFHLAHLTVGLYIEVEANAVIKQPIEVIWVDDGTVSEAIHRHCVILTGENSQLSLIERHVSIHNEPMTQSFYVEVIAQAGSQVKYNAMDQLGKASYAVFKRYGLTQRDATIDWSVAAMNHGDSLLDMHTDLKGDGSHSDLNIISIANDGQSQLINSSLLNIGSNTVANIYQHGVILDGSRLTFNGIGHIVKLAKQADAQQESRVLMLSDDSRGDANPILYIDEFEVTAGHAASVGQVDAEQMYYLMSRGLTYKEAEYLLIRGFLGPVITAMPTLDIRRQMVEIIDAKLRSFHDAI